ncbi:MAG: hypothetical protein H6573_06590 [Lewinellaceae bacterium]|nr:hypothetical protein [Phaeodactylibacter sp.]MCB0612693.1 hypothetical protein [Phaeodactylibacter sp.]MCB9347171.1 hypothetical protein [Lewinellaceae bacterium]
MDKDKGRHFEMLLPETENAQANRTQAQRLMKKIGARDRWPLTNIICQYALGSVF